MFSGILGSPAPEPEPASLLQGALRVLGCHARLFCTSDRYISRDTAACASVIAASSPTVVYWCCRLE